MNLFLVIKKKKVTENLCILALNMLNFMLALN